MRAAVTHDEATRMLREFLTREVFGRVVRGVPVLVEARRFFAPERAD